jgi:hypothetical protein
VKKLGRHVMNQNVRKAPLVSLAVAAMNACSNSSSTTRQDGGVDSPIGTGGAIGSGGTPANGGAPGTGGSTYRTDTTTSGGVTGNGGATDGGAPGSGGATKQGGTTGVGGARGTGGKIGTGGALATGGGTGAGGSLTDPTSRCMAAGLQWKTANKTEFTSYPVVYQNGSMTTNRARPHSKA